MDIMQRQNYITALLVQQNLASALPVRNIPVFDGDRLQLKSFMRSFENCVEGKTNNFSDCLSFLEQYPRGQPRDSQELSASTPTCGLSEGQIPTDGAFWQ